MYKVIFLDDELITLQMLESAIDWQQYSIVLSGVATDGEEGLALFEQVQPDIIIADIRMPKMNGIEFARAIRQTRRPVKIILLSAYAEFEYAQSALTYQISDYLLKPLDENKLEAAVARIVQELDRDTTLSSTIENYRLERAEKLLQRTLSEYRDTPRLVELPAEVAAQLRTEFFQADWLLLLVRVADPAELQVAVDAEGMGLFLKDRFGLHTPVVSLSPVEQVVLCAEQAVQRQLGEIVTGLRLRSQPIKVGMSRIPESFDLLQAVRQTENALAVGYYTGGTIHVYREWQPFSDDLSIKLSDFEPAITELVEQGNSGGVIEQLQRHLMPMFSRQVKPELIETLLVDFSNWVKIALTKQYPGVVFSELAAVERYRLRACATQAALLDFLARCLEGVAEAVRGLLADDPGYYIVKRAKDYARAHYTETDLSLQAVADHVGLSKNHFSRVFHKTTGVKFWDYVTQLRIDKAKELLKGSNRSNSEICHEIGYESEFYFSKIFKKVVGVAAQEFRRR